MELSAGGLDHHRDHSGRLDVWLHHQLIHEDVPGRHGPVVVGLMLLMLRRSTRPCLSKLDSYVLGDVSTIKTFISPVCSLRYFVPGRVEVVSRVKWFTPD